MGTRIPPRGDDAAASSILLPETPAGAAVVTPVGTPASEERRDEAVEEAVDRGPAEETEAVAEELARTAERWPEPATTIVGECVRRG